MGMTNKDAIKWLASIKKDLGNPRHECREYYAQAIDEICELLKPVRPWQVSSMYPWFKCGACHKEIEYEHKFCPFCGKEIKWHD